MSTPDVNLSGTILGVNNVPSAGKVVFTLCNFGDNPPLISGTGNLAPLQVVATAAVNGTWSITLWGNDQISPINTEYQAAVYAAGASSPTTVATYIFNTGTYNLSTQTPVQSPGTPFPPAVNTNIATQNAPAGDYFNGFNGSNGTFSYSAPVSGFTDIRNYVTSTRQTAAVIGHASIMSGQAVLTLSSNAQYTFTNAVVGWNVVVLGAGTNGGNLYTTILSYQSATQVTLNANAGTTVSGGQAAWWNIVDGANINTGINATTPSAGIFKAFAGVYIVDQNLNNASAPFFQGIDGDGPQNTIFVCTSAMAAANFLTLTSSKWLKFSNFTVFGQGSATTNYAPITNVTGSGTTVTFAAVNTYSAGQALLVKYFSVSAGTRAFNDQVYTVISSGLSGTQFEATNATTLGSTADNAVAYPNVNGIAAASQIDWIRCENLHFYNVTGDALQFNDLIVSKISLCQAWNCGAGFDLMTQTDSGTSVFMDTCYANGCVLAGYYIGELVYSQISNCATDSSGCGYFLDGIFNCQLTACGCEVPVNTYAALAGDAYRIVTPHELILSTCYARYNSSSSTGSEAFHFIGGSYSRMDNCSLSNSTTGKPGTSFSFDSNSSHCSVWEFNFGTNSNSTSWSDAGSNDLIFFNGQFQSNVTFNGTVAATEVTAPVNVNTQTSSYVAALADADQLVVMNVAGGNTFTVPTNASVAFPVGTTLSVTQYGAGQVTMTAAGGVTFHNPSSATTRAQYSTVSAVQVAANTWVLGGDLT